jgi:predicted HNH restriction endonuclease
MDYDTQDESSGIVKASIQLAPSDQFPTPNTSRKSSLKLFSPQNSQQSFQKNANINSASVAVKKLSVFHKYNNESSQHDESSQIIDCLPRNQISMLRKQNSGTINESSFKLESNPYWSTQKHESWRVSADLRGVEDISDVSKLESN